MSDRPSARVPHRDPQSPARRQWLAAIATTSTLAACYPLARNDDQPASFDSPHRTLRFNGDADLDIRAQVLDPVTGRCGFRINGQVNPLLQIEAGRRIRGVLRNELPQPTSLHWHGLHVPAAFDGAGFEALAPATAATFDFAVHNPAGLYWYHAHPHGLTGEQVHHGLRGMLRVTTPDDDGVSAALGVMDGHEQLTLLLQDATLIRDAQLPFRARSNRSENDQFGDVVLVNERRQPQFVVSPGWVRLRLLNASSARGLRIALRGPSGAELPLYCLGADAGPLPNPVATPAVFLHPGERVDIAALLASDRTATSANAAVWSVVSTAFDARRFAPAPSDKSAATDHVLPPGRTKSLGGDALCLAAPPPGLPDGAEMPLFSLRFSTSVPATRRMGELPAVPSGASATKPEATDTRAPDRHFLLAIDSDGRWMVNGEANGLRATPLSVRRGATEIWELQNSPISVPHPMHLHGFSFRVLSRRGLYGPAKSLTLDDASRVATDLGLKDTVTVWPGERVRIRIDFSHSFPGVQRFLLHCHNLLHEDAMMMVPIDVVG